MTDSENKGIDIGEAINSITGKTGVPIIDTSHKIDELAQRYARKITDVGNEILRIFPECVKRNVLDERDLSHVETIYVIHPGEYIRGMDMKVEREIDFDLNELFRILRSLESEAFIYRGWEDYLKARTSGRYGARVTCKMSPDKFDKAKDIILENVRHYFKGEKPNTEQEFSLSENCRWGLN